MARNNNIDVMGVLNSITSDQTLARAEQIEISVFDGTVRKVPNELFNYVRKMSSSELVAFEADAQTHRDKYTEDRIFICSFSDHSDYETGHIYLFDAGTLSLDDITPAMGGGEGGGSSSGVSLRVPFTTTELDANVQVTIPFSWSSRNTGIGNVLCTIDGSASLGKTFRMVPGAASWVISGLARGTHTLQIIAIDSSGIQSQPWSITVKVGSLSLESTFSQNKIFSINDDIDITFKYFTNETDKETRLVYSIDDEEGIRTVGRADIEQYFSIAAGSIAAGEHTVKLKIYQYKLDADEQPIEEKYSNELSFIITVAVAGELYLSIVGNDRFTVQQRDRVTLTAKVACVGTTQFNATLEVYRSHLGSWELDTSTVYGSDTVWTLGTNQYLTAFADAGQYKCIVSVSATLNGTLKTKSVEYIITVEQSSLLTIDPIVDTSLMLHLTAKGKSNSDVDKAVWRDIAVDEITEKIPTANMTGRTPINVSLNNFNWGTNGWFKDDNDRSYLNLNGGSYVVIDLQPFKTEIGKNEIPGSNALTGGLTVDIEFETEDVLYNTAKVASCYDGDVGFWIDTEYATLLNSNSEKEIKVTSRIEQTDEVIAQEPKVDGAGNPVYIVAGTENEETLLPTTIVDGVEVQNKRATTPIYAEYIRYSQTGPFQTNFPSRTKTRIAFVIQRGTVTPAGTIDYGDYQFPCMCIYVNGVLTSVSKLSDQDSFFQALARKIYLGCDSDLTNTGKASIYNLRVYNRALSMTEILTNYIADIEDAQEQNDMIQRNGLSGKESNSLPVMDFYVTEEDWENMSKENKIFGRMQYMDSNNIAKTIGGVNMRCQWQGTSTLAYAVKNLKIRLYNTLKWNKTGDAIKGDVKYKYDLGNGIPEYIFTLKADYMDSMHGRNTVMANFVSNLRNGASNEDELTPAQEYRPACRTSVYGFPIQLYVTKYRSKKLVDGNIEFEGEPLSRELYGVYNFNLDKNSCDSLGLETKNDFLDDLRTASQIGEERAAACEANYPNWDCISFEGSANSDSGAGAFNSLDDTKIHSEFELRFEDEGDILDDGEKASSGSIMVRTSGDTYVNTMTGVSLRDGTLVRISGVNRDIDGTYKIQSPNKLVGPKHDIIKDTDDILLKLDGNYTIDYGMQYNGMDAPVYMTIKVAQGSNELSLTTKESAESRVVRRYAHLKKFIKWVMDTPEDQFKRDLHKHVDINAALDYYTTVLTVLMVDNFGKNAMWETWGPIGNNRKVGNNKYVYTEEEVREYDDYIWYPHFYDCDTCLGLDNSGNMRFDVSDGLEYNATTGKDEIAAGVYNTSQSQFWTKFRHAFEDEIKTRYQNLRSYDYSSDVATRRSTYTVESFYEYFYDNQISKISEAAYNNDFKEKYLKHNDYLFMMHGRQWEFFQRFISQRLYFLDTFFGLGDSEDKATIRVEYRDYATVPVVFNITTYQPSYVTVKFSAANNSIRQKVPRNTTVRFEGRVNTSTDQEVLIYNAPNIKSFGDVSRYSPKTVDVSQMTKLTEISVGTLENPNYNLKSLSLGSNKYLTKVVAENCGAMTDALDVSGCTNLKYLSTSGSAITAINFNYNGGGLEEVHFSYATRSVSLNNFNLLKTVTFDEVNGEEFMSNVSRFEVSNCPLLLGYYDADLGQYVDGYLAGNILDKWVPKKQNTIIKLPDIHGKMADYAFLDACANLREKYDPNGTNNSISISGKIEYRGTVIPTKYSSYKDCFPNLTVTYENVTNFSEMFKNYKNINSIIQAEYAIENQITHAVTYEIRNYWKDPKYEKYPDYALDPTRFDRIGNVYYRKLECYDADDQELLAWEIKDRLSPFENASDFSEMFANDSIIEKIYDDTFDKFRFSDNIKTTSMFEGCSNLKYIEVPKIKNIDPYMFKGCDNIVVYLPETATVISDYAFQNLSTVGGKHPLVLFEGNKPDAYIDNIKDARFNVKKQLISEGQYAGQWRALKTEIIECPDTHLGAPTPVVIDGIEYMPDYDPETYIIQELKPLQISYFDHEIENTDTHEFYHKKMIYRIENYDINTLQVTDEPIQFITWNIIDGWDEQHQEYAHRISNIFENPLNIDEMLYGSMENFDIEVLDEMTIPTFNIQYTSSSVPSYDTTEVSFAKLFTTVLDSESSVADYYISKVNLLMDKYSHTSIFKYMFKNTNIDNILSQATLTTIDESAFENSTIRGFNIYKQEYGTALRVINRAAFSGTRLNEIFIPDSVTVIGENAFSNNRYVSKIKYSSAMTTVPIGCFQYCGDIEYPTRQITGFSPDITEIADYAFAHSTGLILVEHDEHSDDPYECHWIASSDGHSNDYIANRDKYYFLDYFKKLTRIGKFAFNEISGISTIKLNPKLTFIGSECMIPPESETDSEEVRQTRLLWDLSNNADYSTTAIQTSAFLGREFVWQSNIGGFNGLLERTVYIPGTVGNIGSKAFSPKGRTRLEYVLTDASTTPDGWIPGYAEGYSRENISNLETVFVDSRVFTNEFIREFKLNVTNDNPVPDSPYHMWSGSGHPNDISIEDFPGIIDGDLYVNTRSWEVYRYYEANDNYWGDPVGTASKLSNDTETGRNLTVTEISNDGLETAYDDQAHEVITITYTIKYTLENTAKSVLYFLLRDHSAIYASLLENINAIEIPQVVVYNDMNYTVTRLANEAFLDNGSMLNAIYFNSGSQISSFGSKLFSNRQLQQIAVKDTDLIIPESVTSIGTGTPFSDTVWFESLPYSDFVYLNKVCIGYSKGGPTGTPLSETDKTIKRGTTIIYDNAFKNEKNVRTITLPPTLQRIESSAFNGCIDLETIDFTPCANNLSYIGDAAFNGCEKITEIRYTKALRHVGNGAVAGTNISKYVFDKGCNLDSSSDPMFLHEENGLDVSVLDLRISASMGEFFATTGSVYLGKLSRVRTLLFGDYDTIDISSCEINEDGVDMYNVNLRTDIGWDNATETINGATHDIAIKVNKSEFPDGLFYKARGEYEHNIDIHGITRNYLTSLHIIQTAMGIKPNLLTPVQVIAKSDIAAVLISGSLMKLFGNRFTVLQSNEF